MLFTLLHRAFKLCSNFECFHQEIDKLKTIFENNGYPKSFVDFCIKKYLDKVFIKKESSTESLEKRTSKFYSKLWTDIFVIRTDYIRETGSPLPQLSVPKKSQVWKYFLIHMTRKRIRSTNQLKEYQKYFFIISLYSRGQFSSCAFSNIL